MKNAENRADVSRRRVLAGTAWATPVILVAATAPPAAASVPVGDDVIDITSTQYDVGWGTTPNSVGAEVSFALGYDEQWANAGITSVSGSLTAIAVNQDTNEQYTEVIPITITTAGDVVQVVIEDVPPGEYSLTYVINADPVVGTDGNTYQAASAGGGPATLVVPEPAGP